MLRRQYCVAAICLLLVSGQVSRAAQSQDQASTNQSDQLQQCMNQLKQNPNDQALRKEIIKLAGNMQPPLETPEEARKHFVKANTFLKGAKGVQDYDLAIGEYNTSLLIAPWYGDAYYNMGLALEGANRYKEAKQAIELYLATMPSAEDARHAQDKIYEIDAKQELKGEQAEAEESRINALNGKWNCQSHCETAEVTVLKEVFKATLARKPSESEEDACAYNEKGACVGTALLELTGRMDGSHIEGTISIPKRHSNKFNCDIPPDNEPFSGKISEDARTLTLNFEVQRYQISADSYLFGALKSCTGVQPAGKDSQTILLNR